MKVSAILRQEFLKPYKFLNHKIDVKSLDSSQDLAYSYRYSEVRFRVGKTFLLGFRFLDMQGTGGGKTRVFSLPFCNSFVTDEWEERGGIGMID